MMEYRWTIKMKNGNTYNVSHPENKIENFAKMVIGENPNKTVTVFSLDNGKYSKHVAVLGSGVSSIEWR